MNYGNNANGNQLADLVLTLEDQRKTKKDMILKGSTITYRDGKLHVQDGKGAAVKFFDYAPTDLCHNQIATKLGIPTKYYDRMMQDYPELLEYNINLWLAKDERIKYMLRTFGAEGTGVARALLSDRYHILDNYDVLFTALEAIKKMNVNVKITRAEVTDRRMYLHVVCPEIEMQAEAFLREYLKENDAAGNGIVSGLVITNSEVGLGTFEIRPRAVIVKCNNGLIAKDESFKRVHLGARMDEGDVLWSQQTKNKNTELVMSQTQDAVRTFLSKDYLGKMVTKIADAHNITLEHPVDCIQHVCHDLGINDKHKAEILKYFINDGDTKASGVFQAITRSAQNMGADMQYEIESAAFSLLPKITKFDKPFTAN